MAVVPMMLTCQELDGFIVDYLDGRLDFTTRMKFKMHISMCGDCKRYLVRYRQTMRTVSAAYQNDSSPLTEDVPENLVQAILSARRGDKKY